MTNEINCYFSRSRVIHDLDFAAEGLQSVFICILTIHFDLVQYLIILAVNMTNLTFNRRIRTFNFENGCKNFRFTLWLLVI